MPEVNEVTPEVNNVYDFAQTAIITGVRLLVVTETLEHTTSHSTSVQVLEHTP